MTNRKLQCAAVITAITALAPSGAIASPTYSCGSPGYITGIVISYPYFTDGNQIGIRIKENSGLEKYYYTNPKNQIGTNPEARSLLQAAQSAMLSHTPVSVTLSDSTSCGKPQLLKDNNAWIPNWFGLTIGVF